MTDQVTTEGAPGDGASAEPAAEAQIKDAGAPLLGSDVADDGGAAEKPSAPAAEGVKTDGEAADAAADEKAAKEATADWPDDWRDRMVKAAPAGERDALAKRLARFSSPANLFRSYMELERKVRSSGLKATLPENPTEDELKAYREANGIPEAPDGYGLAFPEGVTVTDQDKADLASFQEVMHKSNIPPAAAKQAFEFYSEMRLKAEQDFHDRAYDATINARAEIKSEFGKDLNRNLSLANNFMSSMMGEGAGEFLQTRLADGTRLGDNPAFIRLMVNTALQTAGDDTLVAAEYGAMGASVEDQYKAALELRNTDRRAYDSPEHQAKLMKLAEAVTKRRERVA